jgi:hypothetical protein
MLQRTITFCFQNFSVSTSSSTVSIIVRYPIKTTLPKCMYIINRAQEWVDQVDSILRAKYGLDYAIFLKRDAPNFILDLSTKTYYFETTVLCGQYNNIGAC